MLALVAVVALVALLVWFQSTAVSTPQRRRLDGRFGQIAPQAQPVGPTDPDARFEPVPRTRIVVPAVLAAVLLLGAVASGAAGAEPLAAVLLVAALLEAGAAIAAHRHNRRAYDFAVERLLQPRPTGARGPDDPA